jgi:hypothetical protein
MFSWERSVEGDGDSSMDKDVARKFGQFAMERPALSPGRPSGKAPMVRSQAVI